LIFKGFKRPPSPEAIEVTISKSQGNRWDLIGYSVFAEGNAKVLFCSCLPFNISNIILSLTVYSPFTIWILGFVILKLSYKENKDCFLLFVPFK
jgi:hypothetical protein